jgi:SNF2 family DNA or RNA helicase
MILDGYEFRTDPYAHQVTAWQSGRDRQFYGYFMEMGCGKSKVLLDDFLWNVERGRVDTLFILAPNGVQRNWVRNEIPAHLPDRIRPTILLWTNKNTKKVEQEQNAFLVSGGIRIFAMNVEAMGTEKGKIFAQRVLRTGKAMWAIDESTKIKTPGAKRTQTIIRMADLALLRRILTGTPVTQGPFDLYSQFGFLNKAVIGFTSYTAFKQFYGKWETNYVGYGRTYESLISYRNLEELKAKIEPHHFRITKSECLDLPEKVYERRYVEMWPEQRELYGLFRERAIVEINQDKTINMANVLVKLMRLQQVVGGFMPDSDADEKFDCPIPNKSKDQTRIATVLDIIQESNGKVIIWARFIPEIKALADAIKDEFGSPTVVEYHGAIDNEKRVQAVAAFQDPNSEVRFFLGTPHSGGMGLTLTAANTVIFYSNDFSLETRLQAEDRCHRIGTTNKVTYFDLEAVNTIDEKVVGALRSKRNMADYILDEIRKGGWL